MTYQQRQATTNDLKRKIQEKNGAIATMDNAITYQGEGGSSITLSPSIIRQYLVNGQGNVSDQEVMMFMKLCQYQGLNPFLREAYLIKYGNAAATIVTGKEVFTKRAERHPEFRGHEAGIYVLTKNGEIKERKGTISLPNEEIVGGWAKVYREGYTVPIEVTVSFEEYVGRKNDGSINGQWASKPATMIRKVALVQALREAFPAEFGGMYSQEEISTVDASILPDSAVQAPFGDAPMIEEQAASQETPSAPNAAPKTGATISEARAKRMFALAQGDSGLVREIMTKFGYEKSTDILVNDYDAICLDIQVAANEQNPSEQQ